MRRRPTGLAAGVVFLIFFAAFAPTAGVCGQVGAAPAHRIAMLVIDADSFLVNTAIQRLNLPEPIEVRFFIHQDLADSVDAQRFVTASDVVIVDVMGPELTKWLLDHLDPKVRPVYALRGSRDDDTLRRRGIVFDPVTMGYFDHPSTVNVRNLIRRVIHREIDPAVTFAPVAKRPEIGIYHPDADRIFPSAQAYRQWYERRSAIESYQPWVGIMFFSSNLIDGQREPFDILIRRLEGEGFNVLPCFGRDREVIDTLLLDAQRRSRVDLVLAFSLKFYSAIDDDLRRSLADLDVPVLDAINLYSSTIDGWRRDPMGIAPMETVWAIAVPEMSGVAEPTPLAGKFPLRDETSGKTVYIYRPVQENVDRLVERIQGWLRLRAKANSDKRLAVLYYNHSQGKQNVGASYLNVFGSLERIIRRLGREGYVVGEKLDLSAQKIRDAILRTGRNVGSWAPGELDRMLTEETVVRLPMDTYMDWFARLPAPFRRAVVDQWGPPETCSIMVKDGDFIIPAVTRGNLVLMPEPARGWIDDPMKLYHDTTVFPHHQYIAAYLWLKHGFGADAMIHLGTHATHEWLPGKQAGLAPSDPPEVLLTDLPNLYPYIVDDVGEGLQAKRRGRGIVIDHLIPPLRAAGLYAEIARLQEMIGAYDQALAMGSEAAPELLEQVGALVEKTGIDADLRTAGDQGHRPVEQGGRLVVDADLIDELEHYLMEIKTTAMPYGMHTFGRSPVGDPLDETVEVIGKSHPEHDRGKIAMALRASGKQEMDRLVHGLAGRYIPPAEGNDPVRNIKAIPTGNNFFGFSPDKVPSRAAWELGKRSAQQIIDKHLDEHGAYPRKVAVVLWATETIRNQGVNESTIFYLLGMEPRWDRTGRITGTRAIAGSRLGRPRIDVLVNPSGLYRDLFPHLVHLVDAAIRTAAAQTDIDNLIAANTVRMEKQLVAQGMDADEARALSSVRIFTEAPGSYGNGVSELTSASGHWETDRDIARVFGNRTGFAFGGGFWGRPAQPVFQQNLADVAVALHSRSSQLYGLLDNDDFYQYLGGLSLAVAKARGRAPDTLVADQRTPGRIAVEDLARTLGREMRVRYFNPEWMAGMQAEDYAGAREMAHFVEYLWGWQVTTPAAVTATQWEQVFAVYVQDTYDLDLKDFFNRHNPWAYQSITARMLEAVRKEYWTVDEATRRKLAAEYAVNVVEKGVACCDHTCNNPMLNQMVVNIISVPGVLSPEMVEKFKLALEKAAAKTLEKQMADRQQLLEQLTASLGNMDPSAVPEKKQEPNQEASAENVNAEQAVEGLKMEDMNTQDDTTDLTSSGIQWAASLFVLALVGLFFFGLKRRR